MRISRNIFIFTIINLICAIIFINQLPSQVIFGMTGNFYASEYINRWYNLIIPITQVICTFIIYLVDVFNPNVKHKYRYLTSWVAISFTTYLLWVLMFLQADNFELGISLDWPWTVIILFPFALFFLAEGYYVMGKDMDDFSIFGIKMVRESAIVWRKTHKAGGITLILVAFALLTIAIFNEIFWHTSWIFLIAFCVWFFVHYLITLILAYSFTRE